MPSHYLNKINLQTRPHKGMARWQVYILMCDTKRWEALIYTNQITPPPQILETSSVLSAARGWFISIACHETPLRLPGYGHQVDARWQLSWQEWTFTQDFIDLCIAFTGICTINAVFNINFTGVWLIWGAMIRIRHRHTRLGDRFYDGCDEDWVAKCNIFDAAVIHLCVYAVCIQLSHFSYDDCEILSSSSSSSSS